MSKKRKDFIYISCSKLKDDEISPIDINSTYDSEHAGITQIISSGLSDDAKEKYEKGSEITLYLYRLDTEKNPVLYKSVRVKKNEDTYKLGENTKYDVPESFQPFSADGESAESNNDDNSQDETVDNSEETTTDTNSEEQPESDTSAKNTEEQKPEEASADNQEHNTETDQNVSEENKENSDNQEENTSDSTENNEENTTQESAAVVAAGVAGIAVLQELSTLLFMGTDKIITEVKKPKYKKFFRKYREIFIPEAPDIFSLKKEKFFLKEDGSKSDDKVRDRIKKYGLGKENSQIIYYQDKEPVAGIIMEKEFSTMFMMLANGHGIEALLMNLSGIADKSSSVKVTSKYQKYADFITACIDIDCGIITKRAKTFLKKAQKEIANYIKEHKDDDVKKEDANASDFSRLNRDLGKEAHSSSNNTENKINQPTEKPSSQSTATITDAVNKMAQAKQNADKALANESVMTEGFFDKKEVILPNDDDIRIAIDTFRSAVNKINPSIKKLIKFKTEKYVDPKDKEHMIIATFEVNDDQAKLYGSFSNGSVSTQTKADREKMAIWNITSYSNKILKKKNLKLKVKSYLYPIYFSDASGYIEISYISTKKADLTNEAAALIESFEDIIYPGMNYGLMYDICENACKYLSEEKCVSPKSLYAFHDYVVEKVLKAKDRNNLDDSDFGIPEERKYPIHDEAHVRAAIQRFNYVDKKNEKLLANNIIKALKKFDMLDSIKVSEDNRFSKYLGKEFKEFVESYDVNPIPVIREFNVGTMLPNVGTTLPVWGSDFSNSDIHAVVADTDSEIIDKYAFLYDTKDAVKDAKEVTDYLTSNGVDDIDRKENSQQVTYEDFSEIRELNPADINEYPKKQIWFDDVVSRFVDDMKIFFPLDFDSTKLPDCCNFMKDGYQFNLDKDKTIGKHDLICRVLENKGWEYNTDGCTICARKSVPSVGKCAVAVIKPSIGYAMINTIQNPTDMDVVTESVDEHKHAKIDPDIQKVITKLNKMGYTTVASCSGHPNTRVKNDQYRDGILNGKLYTTARIVFDKDYDIGAPKGWETKDFDNGFGIYPKPDNYTFSKGKPDDAFIKWKVQYMEDLNNWVDKLSSKETDEEEAKTESVSDIFEEFTNNLFG